MSNCQKDVKLSKKMSSWQMSKKSNLWTMKEVHKIINWHNKVYRYWCQVWRQIWRSQNCPEILSMHTLRVFGYHHMWYQNWCQYVWTSLCQFIFCEVSIVQVFDFLTIDIFLTTWHHLTFCCPITNVPTHGNRGDGAYGQCGMSPF